MSIRNLDKLLNPQSIVLIGASRKAGSVGAVVARNLFSGGFGGPVLPVHPDAQAIEATLPFRSIEELPVTPDLAILCTPPDTIPDLIDRLGRKGTRAAVVITAGFGELGADGKALQERLLNAAKPHLLRVVGPNCVGLMVPSIGLNASFATMAPPAGDIAFIAQSGAVIVSVVDWAASRGIGLSHLISLGDMADVDFGDLLDYLGQDSTVRAIMLYAENVTQARKFMSAARAAARVKPVIVIKAGRHEEGAKAAASHTGALAGSDDVYDAAFRRAGMLRVTELDEVFEAVETLGMGLKIAGDRLAILTNGGGMGVLATDRLIDLGGKLASLAPETIEALNAVLPKTWSHANPVDIIGDATPERYQKAFEILALDPNHDGILVLNCPTALSDSMEAAQAIADAANPKKKAVLASWLGGNGAEAARDLLGRHKLPAYATPDHAVRAFMHMVQYKRNQAMLTEVPHVIDAGRIDRLAAQAIIDRVLDDGRSWLFEHEAKDLLAIYHIPVARTVLAASPAEAGEAAKGFDGPVALKIVSPQITHKSDVGGVVLGLTTPEDVKAAAQAMAERVCHLRPDATLDGFTVQEMVTRQGAVELIAGLASDPTFGPIVMFGHGGVAVEVVNDKAIGLPPLNSTLAHDLISQTRVARLLEGYRGRPPADREAVAGVLIHLAELAADLPEVVELDINPLLADAKGVIALDARVRVAPPKVPGTDRLAIRPYPAGLEAKVKLATGDEFFLRPIRPEDAPALTRMVEALDPADARLRFFTPLRTLPPQMAARLTQIDYDRDMALVAVDTKAGADHIAGVVRISADPSQEQAEYAVLVRSDLKGHGLGSFLMEAILNYARARGIKTVFGEVLRENTGMLALCREMGFSVQSREDDPAIMHVEKQLA